MTKSKRICIVFVVQTCEPLYKFKPIGLRQRKAACLPTVSWQ